MFHYAGNNPVHYIDPDGRETYDSSITEDQFNKIAFHELQTELSPRVDGKTWNEAQQFFEEHPNGIIYRNPDEICYRFYTNEDKDCPVEYNMITGDELQLIGIGKGLSLLGRGLFKKYLAKKVLKNASQKSVGRGLISRSKTLFKSPKGNIRIERGMESVPKAIQRKYKMKLSGAVEKPWHLYIYGKEIRLNPFNPNWRYFPKK